MIFFFGDTDRSRPGLFDMQRAPSGEQVWLGSTEVSDRIWSESFVTPDQEVRTELLQALSRFRGERVQQGVEVEVRVAAGNDAGRQVAQQLGGALGQYGMGKAAREAAEESTIPITTLRVAPRDRAMARNLLAALSPYLKGNVWIQYDENVSTRSMTLLLADDPVFWSDGTVWYGLD